MPLPYIDYEHDRSTAATSGPAVGRTLRLLYDFVDSLARQDWCLQELHLLCHSMGNYVLRNGLQAWLKLPDPADVTAGAPMRSLTYFGQAGRDPITVRKTFDQIILAAADEDDGAFDDPNKLEMLPRLGNSVTVYHTRKDWVLNTLSSKTKFNGPRLGTNGPDNMAAISDKVSAINVSDVFDYGDDLACTIHRPFWGGAFRADPFAHRMCGGVAPGARCSEVCWLAGRGFLGAHRPAGHGGRLARRPARTENPC